MDKNTDKSYENLLDKSRFYTEAEFISMYGPNFRIFLNHDLLIKDELLFNRYKTSTPTLSSTIQGNNMVVSVKLLHDLLSNEGMYQYLFQNLNNDIGNVVRISLFKDDKKVDSIIISRAVLSNLLLSMNKDDLSATEQMRIALITNVSTITSLRNKYRADEHFAIIDDTSKSIPSLKLFNLLMMSSEKYNAFIHSEEWEINIDGKRTKYDTRVLAYMLVSFMERERILSKYILPEVAYQRYMDIKNYRVIDFESINRNEKSNDYNEEGRSLADMVTLNTELSEYLSSDIPKTSSNLEIFIMQYIKLLKALVYNQEYYASNSGASTNANLDNISNLTLGNNAILPKDFMVIISKLLKDLNIKYTIESNKVSFKYGEYILELDVSNEALIKDMSAAKMNEPISAIRCVNTFAISKKKFDELLSRVNYDYLVQSSIKEDYLLALDKYRNIYVRPRLTRKERLFLFIKLISSYSLKGTDNIAYQYRMFDHFFKEGDNITLSIVSSNMNPYNDYEYVPISIISVLNNDEYVYFIIDINRGTIAETIDHDELLRRFDDQRYGYLNMNKEDIPGIERSASHVR